MRLLCKQISAMKSKLWLLVGAILMVLCFAYACGKDNASGSGGGGSSQCTVGLMINPGDGCSGSGYSLRNDSGVLVLDGNIGGLRMGNTRISGNNVNLNGLRLTRSSNVWTIVSLP